MIVSYNAKKMTIDHQNKEILVDEYVIPFNSLLGYSYEHSYSWCRDHPQDSDTRDHDEKFKEIMNVDGDCQELPKWYSDEGRDRKTEDDDGYTYEEWGHRRSLEMRCLHDNKKLSLLFSGSDAIEARKQLKPIVKEMR